MEITKREEQRFGIGEALRMVVRKYHLLEDTPKRKAFTINSLAKLLGVSYSNLYVHLQPLVEELKDTGVFSTEKHGGRLQKIKHEKIESVLRRIAEKCPSSKKLKGVIFGNIGGIASSSNDTWGWYQHYSPHIEKYLESKGLSWVYAFERMDEDFPWITLFFGKDDIKSKCQEIVNNAVGEDNKICLETGKFIDVCEGYNEAFTDDFSQTIMRNADNVFYVDEI